MIVCGDARKTVQGLRLTILSPKPQSLQPSPLDSPEAPDLNSFMPEPQDPEPYMKYRLNVLKGGYIGFTD